MADETYINLLDPEFYVDPWEAYRWLRDHSPAHWDPVRSSGGSPATRTLLSIEKDAVKLLVLRRISSKTGPGGRSINDQPRRSRSSKSAETHRATVHPEGGT